MFPLGRHARSARFKWRSIWASGAEISAAPHVAPAEVESSKTGEEGHLFKSFVLLKHLKTYIFLHLFTYLDIFLYAYEDVG